MKKSAQFTPVNFTKHDLAKYPFLKESAEHVRKLNLNIEDLANPELEHILERAEERIEEAVLFAIVDRKTHNEEIEILSFPAAIMLSMATGNSFIKKRYALAEAKRTFEDLKEENRNRIMEVAKNLGWKIELNRSLQTAFEFRVNFADYLKNSTHLRDRKWKLVNRVLSAGDILLTKTETARLLSEEVRRHIEKREDAQEFPAPPKKIMEIVDKIKKLTAERIGRTDVEDIPKTMVQSAFPPCIGALYQAFSSGRHLSHIGRFALTSFLVNIGMAPENVIELFKSISDFNEKMTRYQVEHIAGETGSRTRYIPPKCDTLKTHGVCLNPDETCRRVHHPLSYYRIRLRGNKRDS